jgi:hypothetical protein
MVLAGGATGALAQDVSVAADGALLRAVDKVTGQVEDLEIAAGGSAQMKRLTIRMDECRYPTENPSGDAFAYLQIEDANRDGPVFKGWMIASSPALNPLDHPRYDVWVLRCKTRSATVVPEN